MVRNHDWHKTHHLVRWNLEYLFESSCIYNPKSLGVKKPINKAAHSLLPREKQQTGLRRTNFICNSHITPNYFQHKVVTGLCTTRWEPETIVSNHSESPHKMHHSWDYIITEDPCPCHGTELLLIVTHDLLYNIISRQLDNMVGKR